VRDYSTPQSTRPGEEVNRIWPPPERLAGSGWTLDDPVSQSPPEEALLNVVMTFGDGAVRMEAIDIGVSVEGDKAPSVYGRLVDAVRMRLEASGERSELLRYAPDDWFRFVPPDHADTEERRKTLAERLEDAYRDGALSQEEKGLLDDAANQFGSRLSHEE
jgi:hypothetical protein